jgi:niacin transporter
MYAAASERGLKPLRGAYPTAQGVEAWVAALVLIAAGVILPYFVHAFGASPRVLMPMHFPVLVAGVLLSPITAALVGLLTPAISMGLTGFPTSAQVMRMMPELAAYAAVTSVMLKLLPLWPGLSERAGRLMAIGFAVLIAMVVGRLVYVAFYLLTVGPESMRFFASVLVSPAVPGIIAQLILVPLLSDRLQRSL